MERQVQQALESYQRDLEEEAPEAEKVLDCLRRAQLTLCRAEPVALLNPQCHAPRTWLLFYEPETHLRERFDLAPELLVLLIPAKRAQARDIHRAERALMRDYRLDRGLVLVIARDEGARMTLEQPARHTGRKYVFLSLAEVDEVADPQRWLRDLLLDHLGSSDLFAAGNPVFGWDFMGRQQELMNLRRHLMGGRPVGLYGLRKIGKTSLLLFTRKQLIADSGTAFPDDTAAERITIPIHVDLQAISFAESNRPGFTRRLIRSTYETLKELEIDPASLGLHPDLGKRKHLRTLDQEQVEREGTDMLESLIDWAQEAPAQRCILLFLDEYERLLSDDVFPLKDGLAILEYLRGLVQSYPGTFNFLIAGLTRRLASTPVFLGRQNPLFNFVVDVPLAGLVEQEMHELVRRIGKRLSLDFDREALALIWKETGGHPYLAREFGRLIDKAIPIAERIPRKRILRTTALDIRDAFRLDATPTMEEMGRALADLDPSIPFTLSYVQASPPDASEALQMLRVDTVDELRRLGVLEQSKQTWRIRIGCFGTWLQENWEHSMPAAVGG